MIYIITPFFNRRGKCEEFLASLQSQTFQSWKLIAVDSNSTDGTPELLRSALGSRVTVIDAGSNAWWAKCMQTGLEFIGNTSLKEDDIIFICNDDIRFEADFFNIALKLFKKESILIAIQIISSLRMFKTGFKAELDQMKFHSISLPIECNDVEINDAIKNVNCFETRGVFISYSTIARVGKFYVTAIPHYYADFEWTYRAFKLGIPFQFTRSLTIFPTSESGALKEGDLKFNEKFRFSFHKKNLLNPVPLTVFAWKHLHLWNFISTLIRIWGRWIRWLFDYRKF